MPRRSWTDSQLREAVASADCKREVLERLGLGIHGGNYRTIDKHTQRLRLDTSHFTPNYTRRRVQNAARNLKRGWEGTPLKKILTKDSSYRNGPRLKARLLAAGLLEPVCSECGLEGEWHGKPLVHHLDHINGEISDNRLENLRLLCPNCHSQTPTYSGRALRNPPKVCEKCGAKISRRATCCVRCASSSRPPKKCPGCGRPIRLTSARCRNCAAKKRLGKGAKIQWPSAEELRSRVSGASWVKVARQLGVSDTALKKHLRKRT